MVRTSPPLHSLPSLSLVGDGDGDDLLVSVERAFGTTFDPAEIVAWQTVGDMHRALLARLPIAGVPGRCATAMAFHRLRRALRDMSGRRGIAPRTPLRAAMAGCDPEAVRARIRDAGLEPVTSGGIWNPLSLTEAAWVALVAAVPFAVLPWWAALPAAVFVGACLALLPSRLPPWRHARNLTVGGMARETALWNAGQLMAAGADSRPHTVWKALAAVVGADAGLPAGAITPATRFYDAR